MVDLERRDLFSAAKTLSPPPQPYHRHSTCTAANCGSTVTIGTKRGAGTGKQPDNLFIAPDNARLSPKGMRRMVGTTFKLTQRSHTLQCSCGDPDAALARKRIGLQSIDRMMTGREWLKPLTCVHIAKWTRFQMTIRAIHQAPMSARAQ